MNLCKCVILDVDHCTGWEVQRWLPLPSASPHDMQGFLVHLPGRHLVHLLSPASACSVAENDSIASDMTSSSHSSAELGKVCRLLPALLRFAEPDAPRQCQAEALRFVEFCIHHLENDDPAIHHLAVSCCLPDCCMQLQTGIISGMMLDDLCQGCTSLHV